MQTREELQEEFRTLRNAQMKRETCKRTRDLYYDHLADTDILAEVKSDDELKEAINKFKGVS